MIGSAVRLSKGKKLLSLFVAIAMILTLSNITAYSADAEGVNQDEAREAANTQQVEKEATEAPETEEVEATTTDSNEETVETEAPDTDVDDVTDDDVVIDDNNDGENNDSGDDAVVPEEEETTEPEAPVVTEDPSKHSITCNINVYIDDERAPSLDATKVESANKSLAVYFDERAFVKEAWDKMGAGYCSKDYWTNYDNGTKLPGGYNSVEKTIDLHFYTDTAVDKYVGTPVMGTSFYRTVAGTGDAYPDYLQTTVTYEVENGAWNDDTTDSKTEFVSWMEGGNGTRVLQEVPEVGAKADPYYAEGSWDGLPSYGVVAGEARDVTFTYSYVLNDEFHAVVAPIEVYLDDVLQSTEKATAIGSMGSSVTLKVSEINRKLGLISMKNAVKDRVEGMPEGDVTIDPGTPRTQLDPVKVYYYTDVYAAGAGSAINASDGIADKDQVLINFKITNGYLRDSSKATQVYNLDENGNARIAAPLSSPYSGYGIDEDGEFGGGWEGAFFPNGYQVISGEDWGREFNYKYVPKAYEYTVQFWDVDLNVPIQNPKNYQARYLDSIPYQDVYEAIDGYVLSHAEKAELVIDFKEANNSQTLYYSKDSNRDGIADKYQVTVTYSAVNGTVSGATSEIVTLYDGSGNFSTTGVGHLTHIPTFAPNSGFGGGVWSAAGRPTAATAITANTNFVVTYSVVKTTSGTSNKGSSNSGNSGSNNNNDDNSGNVNTGNGNAGNGTTTVYYPVANVDAADADVDAVEDEAAEEPEEAVEEEIEDTDTPMASYDQADEQVIADDENALADYEDNSFNWIPYVIGAIIICAGIAFFIVLRRRNANSQR